MVKPPAKISIPDKTICFQEANSDDISSHFTDDLCQIVSCKNRMKDYCGYCDGQFCVEHIFKIDLIVFKKKYFCVLCEDKYEMEEEEYNSKMRNRIIMNFVIFLIIIGFLLLLIFLRT